VPTRPVQLVTFFDWSSGKGDCFLSRDSSIFLFGAAFGGTRARARMVHHTRSVCRAFRRGNVTGDDDDVFFDCNAEGERQCLCCLSFTGGAKRYRRFLGLRDENGVARLVSLWFEFEIFFGENEKNKRRRREISLSPCLSLSLFLTFGESATTPHPSLPPALPVVELVFPLKRRKQSVFLFFSVSFRSRVLVVVVERASERSARRMKDARRPSVAQSVRVTRFKRTLRADFAVITLAEIVLQLVNDERATDDGVGAAQRNLRILDGKVAPARGGLDVTEITGVTHGIRRRAVHHLVRVKVRSRGHAPVGRVAELVHVQTVLTRGETGDGTDNLRRSVAVLGQLEHAGDARRAREHAHRRLMNERKRDTHLRQSARVGRRFSFALELETAPRTFSSATTRTLIARDDL
jgi:hypothetical protein